MIYVIQVCRQLAGSSSQAVSKPVGHIPLLCIQWKTPDDGQWNCPKHVDFHSKNKFEKLVPLVGFVIREVGHWNVSYVYVWTTDIESLYNCAVHKFTKAQQFRACCRTWLLCDCTGGNRLQYELFPSVIPPGLCCTVLATQFPLHADSPFKN